MNSRVTNLYIGNPNPDANDQSLTVSTSEVQFSAFHAKTKYVVIDVQANDVRVTFDGSTVSSTNGHILTASQGLLTMSANAAAAATFIRDDASDGVLHLTEFVD